jgi:hypothetical protein
VSEMKMKLYLFVLDVYMFLISYNRRMHDKNVINIHKPRLIFRLSLCLSLFQAIKKIERSDV